MGTKLLLGAAQGLRAEDTLNRENAIEDETRVRAQTRQDTLDAATASDRAYKISRRPIAEKIEQDKVDEIDQKRAQAAATVESEGIADLLDSLKQGADPKSAVQLYNTRGAHKINPDTFKYDGTNVAYTRDDGQVVQAPVDQLRKEVDLVLRSSTAKPEKPFIEKYKADEIAFDDKGKEIFRGPQYGKDKTTTPKLIKVGTRLYDPVAKTYVDPPEGTPGTAGAGNGYKESSFNLGSAQKDAREVLAKAVGVKTDKDGNPTEHNEGWLGMSAQTDAMVGRYRRELGAGEIANTVAGVFRDMPTREEMMDEAKKNTERQSIQEPGKFFARKETETELTKRLQKDVDARYEAEYSARSKRAERSVDALARASAARNSPSAVAARSMPDSIQRLIVPGKVRKIRNPLSGQVEQWTRGPDGELQQLDEKGRPVDAAAAD